jgi:iron(III) transport system permease protein
MRLLRIVELVIGAYLILFLVYPVCSLLQGAFFLDNTPSLYLFTLLAGDPYRKESLFNSLQLGALVALSTLIIAFPLSYFCSHYSFRGRNFFSTIILAPLIVPPFVGALGARQILGRFGTVNLTLLDSGIISFPIDFFPPGSLSGIAFLQTMHLFPLMFLSLTSAFGSLNYSQIEVAKSLGAGFFTVYRRIVIPLITPTAIGGVLLTFISSLTDLGTPLMFEQRKVLPVQIYQLITEARDTPLSLALCVCLTSICALIYLCLYFITPRYTASNSKHKTPIPLRKLSPASTFMVGSCFSVLLVLSLIPHLGSILLSLSDRWFMTALPSSWTLSHYAEVVAHPLTRSSFEISVVLSILTIIIGSIIGVIIAYLRHRSPTILSRIISLSLILPLTLPGILFAFGYLQVFSHTVLDPRTFPLPLLLLAYIARRIPIIVNTISGAIVSLPLSMEESAWSIGASRLTTLRRIVIPQIRGALAGAGILTGIACMVEVSESMFLCLDEKYYPVSKALYALAGRPDGIPLAAALSTLVVCVIIGMLILVTRLSGYNLSELLRGHAK